MLFPHKFVKVQEASNLRKAAFISNFVDREGERPDLTVQDFIASLPIESDPKANEDQETSSKEMQRRIRKMRSRRARKVTHTEKVFEPTDEDDVIENNSHVDITVNDVGPTSYDEDSWETKKQATVKSKGNERGVPKIRSRRARQVTHTEKVLRLIDEDDVEYNDGQAGILDENNVEESRPVNDCEIERKATAKGKRNQREKEDEMVGSIPKKKKMKRSKRTKDCGFDDKRRSIEKGDERSSIEKGELKVYVRRRYRNHNLNLKRSSNSSLDRKSSEEKEIEDEETLGSFFIKLKKRKMPNE